MAIVKESDRRFVKEAVAEQRAYTQKMDDQFNSVTHFQQFSHGRKALFQRNAQSIRIIIAIAQVNPTFSSLAPRQLKFRATETQTKHYNITQQYYALG